MITKKKYFPPNAFRICVDLVEEDISGRIYSPLSSDVIEFVSIGEILVKMDELFDRCGYPQAFQDKRSFDEVKEQGNLYRGLPKTEQNTVDIFNYSGKAGTFDLMVKSRQNTSWQGSMYDEAGNVLKEFDGEVEFLSALIEIIKTENKVNKIV